MMHHRWSPSAHSHCNTHVDYDRSVGVRVYNPMHSPCTYVSHAIYASRATDAVPCDVHASRVYCVVDVVCVVTAFSVQLLRRLRRCALMSSTSVHFSRFCPFHVSPRLAIDSAVDV